MTSAEKGLQGVEGFLMRESQKKGMLQSKLDPAQHHFTDFLNALLSWWKLFTRKARTRALCTEPNTPPVAQLTLWSLDLQGLQGACASRFASRGESRLDRCKKVKRWSQSFWQADTLEQVQRQVYYKNTDVNEQCLVSRHIQRNDRGTMHLKLGFIHAYWPSQKETPKM